jgi:hypothetical protein
VQRGRRVGTAALLVAVVAFASGCPRHPEPKPLPNQAPELIARTVPAAGAHYSPDEYLQLIATRVHIGRPQRSAFWQGVSSYFLDRSASVILTVGAQLNGQAVGALPLATLKTASGAVTHELKEGQALAPPMRLQTGDQLTLQASLVETSEENETKIVDAAKTVGSAASLPISTAVPGGGAAFDVAGQFWQLVRAGAKPRDVTIKRDGKLDRPLWEIERIELVPASDLARFDADHDRLLDPKQVLSDSDPTFAVIHVERRNRLYDPNLVLVEPSAMRGKISFFLDEMRESNDVDKVKSCRRLRRYLRTSVGLNPGDETAVVLAAMRESGYDPDRSQAHLEGCLGDEDVRAAVQSGFRWGSCDASAPCRLARELADAWFGRRPLVPFTTAPLAIYDRVFSPGAREDVDPGEFCDLFVLQPSWETPVPESDTTAAFKGVVSRNGQTRPARVRVSVTYGPGSAPTPRIARVDLCDPAETTPECGAPAPAQP